MGNDDSLCARCARHMRTCCQTSEVYTTPGDVARISAHTGRSDFWEFRVPENPLYLDHDDDPEWQAHVFRGDNSRRVLRRQPGGDCTFLGRDGCQLPLHVRPLTCRLYPFEYTADGIGQELAPGCPLELLRPGQSLLQALDMRLADAQRWHHMLYEEIRREQAAPATATSV